MHRSRVSVLLAVIVGLVLSFTAVSANAGTAVRILDLEVTQYAQPADASGRIIIQVQDFQSGIWDIGQPVEWVLFELDVSSLACRGPFSVERSDEFFVLYINDQRLVTFNTKCQYGGAVGYFSTGIAFNAGNIDQLGGWFDDPFNDPVHAVVQLESHGTAPGAGDIVLEGWSTD